MEYRKPFLTYNEQAEFLISRGMLGDTDTMIEHLKDVGYYRLSGYWFIFKTDNGNFQEGTTFDEVWHYYTFDRQLRLLVFDAIERVEIYLRAQLAYELASQTGAFGYENQMALPRLNEKQYEQFLTKCKKAFVRSREPFVIHYRRKYGDVHELPPYWILVNVMDFGMMLTLYKGASVEIRNAISSRLAITSRVLESWLIAINTMRNMCAHHNRLWNRRLGTTPMIPKTSNDARWSDLHAIKPRMVAEMLTILSYILEHVAPDTHWRSQLEKLLAPESADSLARMGFKDGWEQCAFWTH